MAARFVADEIECIRKLAAQNGEQLLRKLLFVFHGRPMTIRSGLEILDCYWVALFPCSLNKAEDRATWSFAFQCIGRRGVLRRRGSRRRRSNPRDLCLNARREY